MILVFKKTSLDLEAFVFRSLRASMFGAAAVIPPELRRGGENETENETDKRQRDNGLSKI